MNQVSSIRSGWLFATICQFGYASPSIAQNFKKNLLPDLSGYAPAQEIQMSEFVSAGKSGGTLGLVKLKGGGFGLAKDTPISTKALLQEMLRNNGMQAFGRFDSKGSGSFGLADQGTIEGRNLHILTAGNMPFCESYFILTMDRSDDQPYYVTGFLPPQNVNVTLHDDLPDMSESWNSARAALDRLMMNSTGAWKEGSRKACLWLENNESRKAWQFEMIQDEVMYKVVAAGQDVLKVTPSYFHIDGKAYIYPNNNQDAKLQKYTLTDLKESGKLSNNFFYVLPYGATEDKALVKSDNNFSYPVDSAEFKQASLFVNANRVLDWFFDNGYSQFGDERIRIFSQAVIKGEVNNAVYKPSFNGNPPSIYVGDGDGSHLANLNLDMDVVSHEFGHHVIFRTIQETEGESAVLHEGIADAFTFLRTGDACLGESICPAGSTSCYVPNRCLRSAENNIILGTSTFPADDHLRGQLISGFIWDLKTKDSIADKSLVKLLLRALDYQGSKSSYRQWVLGLLHADKDLYGSKNCETIKSRAGERGLKAQTKDIDCASGSLPDPGALQNASEKSQHLQGGGGGESEEKKKKDNFGCASLGIVPENTANWLLILAICAPVIAVSGRKTVLRYAKVRHQSK